MKSSLEININIVEIEWVKADLYKLASKGRGDFPYLCLDAEGSVSLHFSFFTTKKEFFEGLVVFNPSDAL